MNLTKHKCWILSVFMPGSYFMTCMDLPCNTSLCWFRYQLPEGASFPCFFLPWKTKFLSTAKEHCCDFGWKNAKNQHYFMQCAEFQIFCLWDLLEISYSCGIVFWIISPFPLQAFIPKLLLVSSLPKWQDQMWEGYFRLEEEREMRKSYSVDESPFCQWWMTTGFKLVNCFK